MKILHINSYYNGSKFYRNLYDLQVKNGLDIDVFVPVYSSINNPEDFGTYTTLSKNHTKYDRFMFHLKHIKIYKDLISRYEVNNFSIIHAHSLFSNGYIAMKLKEDFNIPYIVAVRNTDVNTFFRKIIHLRQLGIRIIENADRVIFLSISYRNEVIQRYIPENRKEEVLKKTSIIPNGIDNFWFKSIGSIKKEPEIPNIRLLQVGDINKNKNIQTTVKAIELLSEKGYKVRLDAVGKVKDLKVFNNIKKLDYVNYLGYKSKEELIKIYRESDIFVLPSIKESFGLVYAEAMSQGLPIIYTRGQGFDGQFLDGEVGYSVEPLNENEVAEKIIRIINNLERLSEKCIEKVYKFKWNRITSNYDDLYRRIGKDNIGI